MIVDVDNHLDPRQMRRQRSSVPAGPGRTTGPFGRIGLLGHGITPRLDLFGLFQAEQQLVLRQRLGPAAEAMTLQLVDNLSRRAARARSASSIALSVPGSSGSLSTVVVMRRLHHAWRHPTSAMCTLMHGAAVQLAWIGGGASRGGDAALRAAPRSGGGRRPARSASRTNQSPAAWRQAHAGAGERIGLHALAHQGREPFGPLAEVDAPGRHHHPPPPVGPITCRSSAHGHGRSRRGIRTAADPDRNAVHLKLDDAGVLVALGRLANVSAKLRGVRSRGGRGG